jgi:hypothetical protein
MQELIINAAVTMMVRMPADEPAPPVSPEAIIGLSRPAAAT